MNLPNLSILGEVLKLYHTVDKSLKTLEEQIKVMTTEFSSLRTEHVKLIERIGTIEAVYHAENEKVRREASEEIHRYKEETNAKIAAMERQLQDKLHELELHKTKLDFELYKVVQTITVPQQGSAGNSMRSITNEHPVKIDSD